MTVAGYMGPLSLDQLRDYLEVKGVIYFEVSGRMWNSDPEIQETPPQEEETQFHVLQKVEESKISVRGRLRIRTPQGQLVADVAAIFEPVEQSEVKAAAVLEEVDLDSSALRGFVEEVGIPIIYPYLREAIHESARKLRIKVPLLGIPRRGMIQLESVEKEG